MPLLGNIDRPELSAKLLPSAHGWLSKAAKGSGLQSGELCSNHTAQAYGTQRCTLSSLCSWASTGASEAQQSSQVGGSGSLNSV